MLDEMLLSLRTAAEQWLCPLGAFVRTDRGNALFVSDAPRKIPSSDEFSHPLFTVCRSNGLLFLYPRPNAVPERLLEGLPALLKADRAKRDVIIRKRLAESMRLHRTDEIQWLNQIWKEEKKCVFNGTDMPASR